MPKSQINATLIRCGKAVETATEHVFPMNSSQPIHTTHLFAPLEAKLIELLRSLSAEEWQIMALPDWRVKDVAAHLLDSALRRLSIARDGYYGEVFTGTGYAELVSFLNRLNAEWVQAFRRVSPPILIALLEETSAKLVTHLLSLDPNATAVFPVGWAGDQTSPYWFDIAREYTERWHHQQQIRDAVNRPGITTRELYSPVLETFVRALPHVYRDFTSPSGSTLQLDITGEAGGTWFLHRMCKGWQLSHAHSGPIAARVQISDALAWKLFTKGLDRGGFQSHVRIEGDPNLAAHLATALAIMA